MFTARSSVYELFCRCFDYFTESDTAPRLAIRGRAVRHICASRTAGQSVVFVSELCDSEVQVAEVYILLELASGGDLYQWGSQLCRCRSGVCTAVPKAFATSWSNERTTVCLRLQTGAATKLPALTCRRAQHLLAE